MVKRKLLKTIGAMAVGVLLAGGTAMAEDGNSHPYNFPTINISEVKHTGTYTKDSYDTSGYVSRTSPDPNSTYIEVWFANSDHYRKSSKEEIYGIGYANPSYSGFNVQSGNVLCLAVYNDSTKNRGQIISAGGKFRL